MSQVESRLSQAAQYLEQLEGDLKGTLTFLQKYHTLYEEVTVQFDDTSSVYHKAQALLYQALYHIVSEYNMMEEAESFYGLYELEVRKSK